VNLAIGGIDAGIVVVYLLGVVLFGMWMGRGQRDVQGYLLGGRNLPWWGLLLSIVATETSTVTFLSIPGVAFDPEGGSLVFLQLTIGYIIGRFVIVFLFLPHYFRGQLFTAYEVLHRRFGGATKQAATDCASISRPSLCITRSGLWTRVAPPSKCTQSWICRLVSLRSVWPLSFTPLSGA
jgi:SSS family solute:Na+ symporter